MNESWVSEQSVQSGIELFRAWAESQLAYQRLPGLAVGLVYDQSLIWSAGFGLADSEEGVPATPDTIYRIASITKLFTATAVLQLRDKGLLQLDDPVIKHLPWFTVQNQYEDAPSITIRHLLTHTSGLPREAAFPYWTDSLFPTLAQIQETVGSQETAVPTESRWKYSNLALSLAGAIVSSLAGQPYETVIAENILQPLGMSSTFVETLSPDHERLAQGYGRLLPGRRDRDMMPFTDCKGITPAANMATTVTDLAKFAAFQMSDGVVDEERILRQSTMDEMQRVHWLDPSWRMGWGLGFMIARRGERSFIGHGGAVLGYRTLLEICPDEKTAVVVLGNADDFLPLAFAEKVWEWIALPLQAAAAPQAKPKQAEKAWQRYVGKYRSAWADLQVLVQNGELVLLNPSLLNPTPTLSRLVPLPDGRFRLETDNGTGAPGEPVTFVKNDAGDVTEMRIGAMRWQPVDAW